MIANEGHFLPLASGGSRACGESLSLFEIWMRMQLKAENRGVLYPDEILGGHVALELHCSCSLIIRYS